jgi:3-hydroxybutyryl-CoA dehydratase
MMPKVGATASLIRTVTDEDVRQFADLTGDTNPIHLDNAYAANTRFGKRIAHGMFAASLLSAVLGTKIPGPGTIYLSHTLQFVAPVFVGDTITATIVVTRVREDKPILTCETVCSNQTGATVLKGEAVVLLEDPSGASRGGRP